MNDQLSPWDIYSRWNQAIAAEVYSERVSGKPAYLDLEDEVLRIIAARAWNPPPTIPREALAAAVIATLRLSPTPQSIFSEHVRRIRSWNGAVNSDTAPPCIALLSLFSLVAEDMAQTGNFSSNNYYDRLREQLRVSIDARENLIRDFRNETPLLWNALNSWLEELGGRRGLPTAYAFDRRRFVGIPISQALVREQDRRRLPQLFAEYGLQPGQHLAVYEMRRLLAEWLPRGSVTISLKNLWRRPDTQDRIAEVACVELEAWDGTIGIESAGGTVPTSIDLLLAAEIRFRPRPKVDLLVVIRASKQVPLGSYCLGPSSSRNAAAVLERCGGHVSLTELSGTSWLTLEPADSVSIPDLLFGSIELRHQPAGFSLTRGAPQLVLLRYNAQDGIYVEVSRVELLETYLVLAYGTLAGKVADALKTVARPGYQTYTASDLLGLPEGWTAFYNVQLTTTPYVTEDDLKPLIALSKTQISLGGGLTLPGLNVWHVAEPPEVGIASGLVGEKLRVTAIPVNQLRGSNLGSVLLGTMVGSGALNLAEHRVKLAEGDYRLTVEHFEDDHTKTKTLASMMLHRKRLPNPTLLISGSVD